ncbi:MAG TPA: DNA alkylation repair protein [Fastidiosipila sp.]|nr:DNA alkylation repair protein [Fastidiosipila sp.]
MDEARQTIEKIRERLFLLQDEGYRDFIANLIPTIDKARIIGVRTPMLKSLAKEMRGTPDADQFISVLPHHYYEENNLHGLIISESKAIEPALSLVERFLPFVDNWATCDSLRPKAFAKNQPHLLEPVQRWLSSEHEYTVRFAIGVLMNYFLGDAFRVEHLDLVASIDREEYYIRMMVAWYFATALTKRFAETLPWIEEQKLPLWNHNKAIQKAIESRVVTDEQKAYLRTLRRKT